MDVSKVCLDPRDGFFENKMTPEEETWKVTIGDRSLKVGMNLTSSQERRLVQFLTENMDLFAWSA